MKKIFLLILSVIFIFLSSCGNTPVKEQEHTDEKTQSQSDEIRAVWITYYEISQLYKSNKTDTDFIANAQSLTQKLVDYGINTVMLHAVAFGDSLYESQILPWSSHLTGTQGNSPDYNPFELLFNALKEKKIKVEGWINPFRISYTRDIDSLSDKNYAKSILTDSDTVNDSLVMQIDEGIFLNPCEPANHSHVYKIAEELLKLYSLDAIHIDDYFYPSTSELPDSVQYNSYKDEGGMMSAAHWRRSNVNSFLSGLYRCVKSIDPKITLSVSPCANMQMNYNDYYADVEYWCANSGYVDVIIPQVYYGFEHQTQPYETNVNEWKELIKNEEISLVFGVAAYKCGEIDDYAGSGKNEWIDNEGIIARQIKLVSSFENYSGFALFSYSSLFADNLTSSQQKQRDSLKTHLSEISS